MPTVLNDPAGEWPKSTARAASDRQAGAAASSSRTWAGTTRRARTGDRSRTIAGLENMIELTQIVSWTPIVEPGPAAESSCRARL